MKTVQSDPYSAHQEVILLLPWYVNQTLTGAELKLVEEHLGVCLTCKREINNLQKLSQVVNQASAIDTAEQAAFAQLKKRLHQPQAATLQQPAAPEIINFAQHQAIKRRDVPAPPPFRPAMALAAVLLLSLIVPSYFKINQMLSNDYHTLSEGGMQAANLNEGHVVFADNMTLVQINQLLQPFAGKVIGQPTDQAVYTVRFEQIHAKDALLVQLAELKKNPQVVFAEPANTALVPTEGNLK